MPTSNASGRNTRARERAAGKDKVLLEPLAMHALLQKLAGGDRRSIGAVEEVVAAVRRDARLFAHLWDGLLVDDDVVRMRAADAIEKITRDYPEYLQPHKSTLIRLAAQTTQIEVRWHLAQMLPRLRLSPAERAAAARILKSYLGDKSRIVVTCAMQSLVEISQHDAGLQVEVVPIIVELTRTGSPAMRSRGRKLLEQLHQNKSPKVLS